MVLFGPMQTAPRDMGSFPTVRPRHAVPSEGDSASVYSTSDLGDVAEPRPQPGRPRSAIVTWLREEPWLVEALRAAEGLGGLNGPATAPPQPAPPSEARAVLKDARRRPQASAGSAARQAARPEWPVWGAGDAAAEPMEIPSIGRKSALWRSKMARKVRALWPRRPEQEGRDADSARRVVDWLRDVGAVQKDAAYHDRVNRAYDGSGERLMASGFTHVFPELPEQAARQVEGALKTYGEQVTLWPRDRQNGQLLALVRSRLNTR